MSGSGATDGQSHPFGVPDTTVGAGPQTDSHKPQIDQAQAFTPLTPTWPRPPVFEYTKVAPEAETPCMQ